MFQRIVHFLLEQRMVILIHFIHGFISLMCGAGGAGSAVISYSGIGTAPVAADTVGIGPSVFEISERLVVNISGDHPQRSGFEKLKWLPYQCNFRTRIL